MLVYHGTTAENAQRFVRNGIDAHLPHPHLIQGPQNGQAGLFVSPKLRVARTFGLFVLAIDIDPEDLKTPPALEIAGADLNHALTQEFEPQALLVARVEAHRIRIVEAYPNGYLRNPYEMP
jgi:hypothetical protein